LQLKPGPRSHLGAGIPEPESGRTSLAGSPAKSHICALGAFLTVTLIVYGVLLAQAPAGSGHQLPGRLAKEATRTSAPTALTARTVSLDESGSLQLTSRKGFTLNERGAASGTVKGTIYVHLRIVSTSRVTAEINIYPAGGSITGYGTAGYKREGATGSFSGSLSIDRGTGTYNDAHGSGLSFTGTIRRSSYAVTVHVSGTVTD
jgi:hypothetical protein